ncbi:MAG: DUF4920 domain-containing protein [Myxococcota bacterium]
MTLRPVLAFSAVVASTACSPTSDKKATPSPEKAVPAAAENEPGSPEVVKKAPVEAKAAKDKADAPQVMDECPHAADHGGECAHAEEKAAPTAVAKSHYGHAFKLAKAEPLAKVIAAGPKAESPVQVSGKVGKVCQMKGCWMELHDGDVKARVFTYDGDFFMPTDTQEGRVAVVEGKLEPRQLTKKMAEHLDQESGAKQPGEKSEARQEWILKATSIALSN